MLLYRVLSFFWSNNRVSILSYIFGSITTLIFFFFRNHNLEADFNALSLLSILNIIFCIFSLLLSRNLLYKFYRNKTHYFFAQLPISSIQMRLYEHICYFIICAIPYLLILPALLFQVYINGLWSSSQVIGFLSYQLILWLFFANYSLCIAMLGRICWYLFWGILVGFSLYIQYSKNYELDVLGFLDVRKVLFKASLITPAFIIKYIITAVLLYISAFILSFSIDKNAFGLLHAKENSLSRGIFILYIAALISANFYYIHNLSLSKSKFTGLHLTQVTPSKNNTRANDYWSSSVQLTERQSVHFTKEINHLNQELINFSKAYQLKLPSVHYQHSPKQTMLKALYKDIDSDNDLEVMLNFNQLNTEFYTIERDLIVEFLRMLSRGWIEKEDKLIYLRGLAAQWSWKDINPSLINSRLQFLTAYPDFSERFKNKQWLSIFQDSGACLFDSLAMLFIQNIASSSPKHDWHQFIYSGLNLDHTWVPFHFIRSIFSLDSQAENTVKALTIKTLLDSSKTLPFTKFDLSQSAYSLETRELYPDVFQVVLKTSRNENDYQQVHFHLFTHTTSGRQVDFQSLQDGAFSSNTNNTEHISKMLMLKKDKFSSTFSWHHQELNCRVYAPWKYVEL